MSNRPSQPIRQAQGGNTLVEALISTAVAAIGIAGLCVANANCLMITRAHKEVITADQCLHQRTEQFHAANWTQITGASGVAALLGIAPVGFTNVLPGHNEQVTVFAYPPVVPAAVPIVVTRVDNGVVSIVSQPGAGLILRNLAAVRIDFRETWLSVQGGRPRERDTSMIVVNGGLIR